MLCQTCPKCQFRLAPGRHICGTCGHVLSAKRDVKPGVAKDAAVVADNKTVAKKQGFWKSLFSVQDDTSTNDKRHEEPALGET
jgi:hypothetical protein